MNNYCPVEMLHLLEPSLPLLALAPALALGALALFLHRPSGEAVLPFRALRFTFGFALACAFAAAMLQAIAPQTLMFGSTSGAGGWLRLTPVSAWFALLVHALAFVIGGFSLRYLRGEAVNRRLTRAFVWVLVNVHLLLLADHWLVLVVAWALVGRSLEPLLCFYPDRPFARLAALKKRLADRGADLLLVVAGACASWAVGSGSLSALDAHLQVGSASPALQLSAICLVLAVILRTAALPMHGWLIQVMEAPTPVSALLHAGVVNLGGFVLIRFAGLLEAVPAARWILVASGLLTAILAGLVMLTRISIKVRLAWSTVAQMGFMMLECGLGLYTIAALHIIGHSIYKANAFLAASSIVQDTRIRQIRGGTGVSGLSLMLAPVLAFALLWGLDWLAGGLAWPLWWSAVMAFAWAPLFWGPPAREAGGALLLWRGTVAVSALVGLTMAAMAAHALPLGLRDAPLEAAGLFVAAAFAVLYLMLAWIHHAPDSLAAWRRSAYAGFYLDEIFTRIALTIGSSGWMPVTRSEWPRTGALADVRSGPSDGSSGDLK